MGYTGHHKLENDIKTNVLLKKLLSGTFCMQENHFYLLQRGRLKNSMEILTRWGVD